MDVDCEGTKSHLTPGNFCACSFWGIVAFLFGVPYRGDRSTLLQGSVDSTYMYRYRYREIICMMVGFILRKSLRNPSISTSTHYRFSINILHNRSRQQPLRTFID